MFATGQKKKRVGWDNADALSRLTDLSNSNRMTDLNFIERLSNLSQSANTLQQYQHQNLDINNSIDLSRLSSLSAGMGNFSPAPPTLYPENTSMNRLSNLSPGIGRFTGFPSDFGRLSALNPFPFRGFSSTMTPSISTSAMDHGYSTGTKQQENNQLREKLKFIVGLNSLDLFMSFVEEYPDPENANKTIADASRILKTECYEAWINTRRASLKKPEESFRRALTAHVCGADRRRPFPEHVEKAMLYELRKQQTWECFEGKLSKNENKPIKIGEQGFRTMGFHEKRAHDEKNTPTLQILQMPRIESTNSSSSSRPSLLRRLSSSLTSMLPSSLLDSLGGDQINLKRKHTEATNEEMQNKRQHY